MKEFGLLEFLMQRRGRCCSRSRVVARGVADVSGCRDECGGCVHQLFKEEAGSGGGGGRCGYAVIETVRGEGYQMGGVRKTLARFSDVAALMPASLPRPARDGDQPGSR